jgi:hypothetical protein
MFDWTVKTRDFFGKEKLKDINIKSTILLDHFIFFENK